MRVTMAAVNARTLPMGYEFIRGRGYFYFMPVEDGVHHLPDSSVMVYRLSAFTVEEWVEFLNEKLEEAR